MINHLRNAVEFASHLPRYNEIVRVLFRYGFADVLKLVTLQRVLGIEDAKLTVHETGPLSELPEIRLRMALEELGPTFVKLGQIVSSRRDLVNEDYYAELCLLHASVPTFPGKEAEKIIHDELGVSVQQAFSRFEREPIGGASIAQVHRAWLHDGTPVAVKVQRPDITKVIDRDLAIIMDLAKFADTYVPEIAVLNPVSVVQEFAETLRKELDFTNEASNAERFAMDFDDDATVFVPRVYREHSSAKVLTMTFMSGLPVDDPVRLRAAGVDPEILANNISVLIYKQIFNFGFFHGDPHPGNMTVLEDGVVGLYDYGMMGTFTPAFRSSIAHMIAGLAQKDHSLVMRSIVEMSEEGYADNPDRMMRSVEEFSDQHLNQPLKDINLGFVLNKLLELLRDNRLRMKGSFYLGIKALSQVEATGRALNPDLNFVLLGQPYATRLIENKYHPGTLWNLLKRLFADSVDFLEEFPHDFRMVYGKVKRGQINIPLEHKIDPEGFEPLRMTLDSIANRLTNAIIAASVLICSSILILSGLPPRMFEIPIIGIVGLAWGAYMCLRLVLSIWKHGGL